MKLALVYLLMVVLFSSCRELVQDEFPEFEPVPVINSILAADSSIKVHVSLTGSIDTNRLTLMNDAIILLYVDGQFEETIPLLANGIYKSNTCTEPLKTYSCEVTVPGYPVITCSDSIPEPSVITDIIHIDQAGVDEEGLSYPAIKFTFSNETSKRLYFEAIIKLFEDNEERIANLLNITDEVLLNEGLPIAVFSNSLIAGDYYSMTINYTTGSASSSNSSGWKTDLFPLILELRSVSYNYYQYVRQLYLYEQGRYPEFIGSSLTAFPLYSNFSEGYGIFAGYSSTQSDTIHPNSYIE